MVLPALLFLSLTLAGCGPSHLLREGQRMLDKGDVENGLSRMREAAFIAPNDFRHEYLKARDENIQKLAVRAQQLSSEGKLVQAKQIYEQILRIEPNTAVGRDGLRALDAAFEVQELMTAAKSFEEAKDREGAIHVLRKVLILQPNHLEARKLLKKLNGNGNLASSPNMLFQQFKKPISIEFRDASVMQIFDIIARTSGLNFIFDREVRGDQRSSIFLRNSTVEAALHFTLLTNQLAYQVLDGNTVLIYPNQALKQKEYQDLIVRSFFLKNANAADIATTLGAVLKTKDLSVDEKTNAIIMRDSAENIRMAEKIIAVRDIPEPEVMLEVEVLEIKRTRLQELGIKFPDSFSLTPLTSGTGAPLTLRDLTNNINSRTTGVSTPNAVLNAKAQDSDVKILANPRIRAKNLEEATIQIGERVPNVVTTSTPTFVSESVTYTDVGLKLVVRPRVYLDNEVGINIKLDVSNVVSQSQTKNGATTYQLGTRNAATALRLRDGETEILAGLINNEDRRTGNKIPILGDFPLIGRLFGSRADNSERTEIVLAITPRIIRNIQLPSLDVAEFSSGTESGQKVRLEERMNAESFSESASTPLAASSSVTTNDQSNANNSGIPSNPSNPSPISLYVESDARLGEPFKAQVALSTKDSLARLAYTLSFDPKLFEFVSAKPALENTKENNIEVQTQPDGPGQLNISIAPAKGTSFKIQGIHLQLQWKALAKTPNAMLAVTSIHAILPSGEIENPALPQVKSVAIK